MTNSVSREGKGKSLIAFPSEYVAVDLETTGTSPKWDEIIEIGAVHVKDGEMLETFQELVNPGFVIDAFIESLTGITNEMLKDADEIEIVLPRFTAFLGEGAIVVGHNIASFDSNFLYDAGLRLGKPIVNDFVDTMKIARKLHKDWEHHRLCDLCDHFGIANNNAHRALADSLASAYALEAMRGEAVESYGSIDGFVEFAKMRSKKTSGSAKGFGDIVPAVESFDESHPFYEREIVITGTLPNMERREAAQKIVNVGGIFSDSLRKRSTNYLVVADYSNCKTIKGKYSEKHVKALKYKAEGADIEIIDSDTFFDILSQ